MGSRWSAWLVLAGGCGWPPVLGERCANRLDDDRNGLADCADPACDRHCDTDGDGHVDARLRGGTDCDDADPRVHPAAPERCNGRDDDCDALVDDDDPDVESDPVRVTQYVDLDGDGVGTDEMQLRCPGAVGFAPSAGDCDDADPRVATGLPEVCDGIENDCDGVADALDPSLQGGVVVFRDRDGDGSGDPGEPTVGCVAPGWSADPTDCDDRLATVHPGAPELCDGHDNDCDGAVLDGEDDADGDGDPVCTDCDDADPLRSSRHEEVCGTPAIDEDCDGAVDADDPSLNPYSCGYCPPIDVLPDPRPPIHLEWWNPCLLDPEAVALCSTDPYDPETHDQGARLHRVRWRTDEGVWRPELFVFLPPGPGRENRKIAEWAAMVGYRTISLGYPNQDTVNQACVADDAASDCYRDVLYETTYGVDRSAAVEVVPADAIETRLATLLEHLWIVHPEMRFDRYLRPDGRPDWSRIVIAGWSGGGGQAGFLAKYETVAGALLMSSPKDHESDPLTPADWIGAPGLTPGCAIFTTWHVDEPHSAEPVALLSRAWDLMGVPAATFDVDLDPLPIPLDVHRVSQSVPEEELAPGCKVHSAVGRDRCMRDEVLFPAYGFLMCQVGAVDPATCAGDLATSTSARTGR